MANQISERAAERSRITMTRERLRRAISGDDAPSAMSADERAEYRKVRAEIQADTDLDLDPRYSELMKALVAKVGRRRAYEVIFTPEKVLDNEMTHPLYNEEVAQLLDLLGAETDARTVERMVTDGVVPPPPQIGMGTLPRNAYFARHVLAIAFRVLCVREDREELRHDARVLTGGVSEEAMLLLRTLPGQPPRR